MVNLTSRVTTAKTRICELQEDMQKTFRQQQKKGKKKLKRRLEASLCEEAFPFALHLVSIAEKGRNQRCGVWERIHIALISP